MEPPTPIDDDEFDALWDKAVEEATHQNHRRRSAMPKEPTERRKPRAESFPALSPSRQEVPGSKSGSGRRLNGGGNRRHTTLDFKRINGGADRRHSVLDLPLVATKRNSAVRSSSRDPSVAGPPEPPQERNHDPPKSKALRRHSSMELDEIEASPRQRPPRRSSVLTESEDRLQNMDSLLTQISFSNLPEITDLMKKPTIGTAATATSDFSDFKHPASKWSDGTEGETSSGEAKKSNEPRKVTVDESQLKAASYFLDDQDDNKEPPLVSLPAVHSISAFKQNKEQLSGLVISRDSSSEVLVRKITPTSIFAETPLREGHEILTINDRRVKCPLRATTIVKSIKGEVNLLVSEGEKPPGTKYIKAKIDKHPREGGGDSISMNSSEPKNKELGLFLESSRHGLVRVSRVDEDGVFGTTPIQVDDMVVAINGESAQSVDIVMTSLGKFYRRGGVAILLVYSMVDLRLGLMDQIIKSPWEILWDANFQGATISRKTEDDLDHSVSFYVVFDDDWSCEILPSGDNDLLPSDREEINLAIDKMNDAISLAVKNWNDAVRGGREDNFTAAC